MQNKKSPALLFGIVIVALASVFIWNARTQPTGGDPHAEEHKQEELKSHEVSAEDRKRSSSELMGKLSSSTPAGAPGEPSVNKALEPGAPDASSLENAKEPTILVEKSSGYKPTPNDSGTATHWYDGDSRSAKRAEEMNRSRG
ncbi:MAG: hypothetical protein JST30_02555 [Armatimonadetes bacterium]|nr:hypothetical protein [Armatimonadota bacterium]